MGLTGFPLRYLTLEDARGRRLVWRDMPGMLGLLALMSLPFLFIPGANFFHKDGFVDKIGTFSSVLTGFYVAGLVAVATFPRNLDGLDKVIEIGAILLPSADGERERLTRREYVCAMFGYLAFMSMIVTIVAIGCVTVSDWFQHISGLHATIGNRQVGIPRRWLRGVPLVGGNIVLSSLFMTTIRALYYLIDRLYVTSPKPLPRPMGVEASSESTPPSEEPIR
ncbi:hypothetical protein [Sphingomonas oligoaromativorans]|uniref:hypothetical protein n=1 Tax=Sphingomonas oligoaromativorans TaxID=575322 RepID=UPI0014202FE9|nr:hypothetical protein [Sphingomonas oligoaromativorans]NIJ34177.1 hypothetical protein [Sphingomonas oligoaromativorans]